MTLVFFLTAVLVEIPDLEFGHKHVGVVVSPAKPILAWFLR
jgi:hypothetical protein